jgi:hypothetical protein
MIARWIPLALLCSVPLVQGQTPIPQKPVTNAFVVTGSKMQEGKWLRRITTLPEGATITLSAEALEGLQSTKAQGEPMLLVRLGPTCPDYKCDSRGRWSAASGLAFFTGPYLAGDLTLTAQKGAALYISASANARFRIRAVITPSAPTLPPPPPEAAAPAGARPGQAAAPDGNAPHNAVPKQVPGIGLSL